MHLYLCVNIYKVGTQFLGVDDFGDHADVVQDKKAFGAFKRVFARRKQGIVEEKKEATFPQPKRRREARGYRLEA